ncbi:MAG: tetratricopeptide repeat protein, partial [Gemmataceae bacterium]|nr:tetratricopeptide repeat protein [Gemmataceae bacterium]
MNRRFEPRAAVLLLAILAVLCTGAYFLRGWQVRRNAGVFLDRADKAHDEAESLVKEMNQLRPEDDTKDSAAERTQRRQKLADQIAGLAGKEFKYLHMYLGQVPKDDEVNARYALLFRMLARSPRELAHAYYTLEAAIRRLPDREDLRWAAIGVADSLRRPDDALFHLSELNQAAGGKDARLLALMAERETASRRWAKAAALYEQSAKADPKRFSAVVARARLLRTKLGKAEEADALVRDLGKAHHDSPEAQVAVAGYLRETDLTTTQREEMRRSLRELAATVGKKLPTALLLAASMEQEAGDDESLARALDLLKQGRADHPGEPAFAQELARLHLKKGRTKEALAALREVSGKLGTASRDFLSSVELTIEAGENEDARKMIERLGQQEEAAPLRAYLEGRLALAEERWLDAMRLLEKARAGHVLPPDLQRLVNWSLSRAHRQLGNHDRELDAATASLADDPAWLPGLLARADALASGGLADEALAAYLALQGRAPDARFSAVAIRIGKTLRLPVEQQEWKPIEDHLAQTPPGYRATARFAQASARLELAQGKRKEARERMEAEVAREPANASSWLLLAEAASDAGKDKAAVEAVLGRAEKALGDRIELRLARARQADLNEDAKAADALLDKAEKDAVALGPKDGKRQAAWLRALADARRA